MRLAIILRRLPIPVHAGLHLIIHHVLLGLQRRHQLQAFVLDQDWDGTNAEDFFVPFERFTPGPSLSGSSAIPRIARYYGTESAKVAWLQQRIDAHAPDAILGFGYDLAAYLALLSTQAPRVLDAVDSEILFMWRQIKAGARTWQNAKHLIAAVGAARSYLRPLDALIAVSEEDSANLRRFTGNHNVTTIGNGVDSEFFQPDRSVVQVPGRVIFTGSLNWPPNRMAVDWFLRHCWGRIKANCPNASLFVIGKMMTDEQRAMWERYPDVRIVGFVPDIRTHVRAAQVSVAPMVSGSGIKNKILEAWAMGQPVIATRLAARGLVSDGQNMLLADTPGDFADTVVRALADPALRERIGAAGRATVLQHYSWERVVAQFEGALQAAAGHRR